MLIAVSADSNLGARALLYYLIPYAAMSIGSFAVVAARERELGVPVTFENMAGSVGNGRCSESRCGRSCSASRDSR